MPLRGRHLLEANLLDAIGVVATGHDGCELALVGAVGRDGHG